MNLKKQKGFAVLLSLLLGVLILAIIIAYSLNTNLVSQQAYEGPKEQLKETKAIYNEHDKDLNDLLK